jgi:putative salt-induced outer membrane protein
MYRVIATALLVLTPVAVVFAEDPPPPPQHQFIGKGQFGFLESKGNTDATSLNAALDILRYDDAWKNELFFGGLYGKSAGIVSAERWEFREQTDYSFTPSWFAFAGLHFEHDMFNGFVYQASITGGIGYKVLDTPADKLSFQAGAGYRRLRTETLVYGDPTNTSVVTERDYGDAEGDAVGSVGMDFMHAFNKATAITDKLTAESGKSNTSLNNALALTVKMSTKLALSLGYSVLYNTAPTGGLKKLDQISSVNLQYAF